VVDKETVTSIQQLTVSEAKAKCEAFITDLQTRIEQLNATHSGSTELESWGERCPQCNTDLTVYLWQRDMAKYFYTFLSKHFRIVPDPQ
jgi:uncharacterized protein with PIN domain